VRLCGLFQRGRREREFAEELKSHLAMHIEDNLRRDVAGRSATPGAFISRGFCKSPPGGAFFIYMRITVSKVNKRRTVGYAFMAVVLACVTMLTSQTSNSTTAAPQETPPLDVLITWLDDPSTAWVATAWLQQMGEPAIPALLAPGRTQLGPHGRFTVHMLALAKIGEPAIPHIMKRLSEIFSRSEQRGSSETSALVKVIGSIGPAAIPALVEVASKASSWIVSDALEEIVLLEPPVAFGQDLNPWYRWRPQNDRSEQIARHITPCLPRIEEIMDREAKAWLPQAAAPQRPAAYLLARWGGGRERARGLKVLEGLAHTDEPFYYPLRAAQILHRLRAPGAAPLLKEIAARVSNNISLKDKYLLNIGIELCQIGDQSYDDLITPALRSSDRSARIDAIRFAGKAGDLRLVPPLIDLLGDKAETGVQRVDTINGQTISTRETVGDFAAASLRRLTFQSIARDDVAWRTWWEGHQESSYRDLLTEYLASLTGRIKSIPIWEANRLIGDMDEISDPLILPLFREYLNRQDLNASLTGPNTYTAGGGDGPAGMYGPLIITSLLRFAQLDQPEGQSLLEDAMQVVDPGVRIHAALAVGSYDRRAALDHLIQEMDSPDPGIRNRAADFLLLLDDARGIPALIDRLEDSFEPTRNQACRNLRLYTQQPLPCDGRLPAEKRTENVKRWRSWLGTVSKFEPRGRQAALDRLVSSVPPVSYSPDHHVQ
jgi:HEAT repeats